MNGQLVIAKGNDPAFAVFVVVGVTGNGWLHCKTHSSQQGVPERGDHVFKFRRGHMRIWKQET